MGTNENNRHVVPNSERGGFDVVGPGAQRSSGHFLTQGEAIQRATEIVRNKPGGGEVRIHRPNGQIRDSNTINRPDPRRSRG